MKERLQKILARAGVASRRAAESLVASGRVRVNGRIVTELGTRADPRRDRIEVDGRRIVLERPVYYLLHKPRGVVTTLRDPEGRPSLGELLAGIPERVYPVGRLDFHTQGALLVTNDGELADALLHPSRKAPKVYVAKVRGLPDERALEALRNGVRLDDGELTAPADVVVLRDDGKSSWLRITIHEGKNRQIHRMGEAVGHTVLKLHRLSFAGLSVEGLRPGQLRPLEEKELEKLKKAYVLPARGRKRKPPAGAGEARDEPTGDPPDEAPVPPRDEALARAARRARAKSPRAPAPAPRRARAPRRVPGRAPTE
jgi:23S rRNA pseudouridine2605 synthase